MDRIYIDNDHVVTLSSLVGADGEPVTVATVSMTLYESDGTTQVGGVSWPVPLTHDASGTYTGNLSASASVTQGKIYKVKVTATHNSRTYTGWQDAYCELRQA